MRGSLLMGATCFFLAVASAGAQGELTGENLLVEIPSGYELGHQQKTDQGEINEFIPKGETVENWSEMITVQLLPAHNNNAKFYAIFESLVKQACTKSSTEVIATTEENGYPVQVFMLSCPANQSTDMGEVTFIKTVEGKDKFYVVQKGVAYPQIQAGSASIRERRRCKVDSVPAICAGL